MKVDLRIRFVKPVKVHNEAFKLLMDIKEGAVFMVTYRKEGLVDCFREGYFHTEEKNGRWMNGITFQGFECDEKMVEELVDLGFAEMFQWKDNDDNHLAGYTAGGEFKLKLIAR
ncbi:hypothetical protein A3C89_01390 [Candidatus Kaiserbacteria bacterium RIFCSPHIGHO2_02_FULL_50_50]|uniref:Uncharacterized protein n=1 Tax=Candidatus Kaiserbacteria bacterium RIFCSPHIGHO2_02_FULL_50_50 TaxID=1798492 RepID=A0A1F6DC88_9BACT|nr:MAG: hypothetical protein A3C89_01390 [Candidatus Kaiserbacteria bacterium RIFCSPHIGHO2_02_FULL_50_50]OGG89296.1 MAG: hypothetical protein A3G62_01465 [Candidatus Kaiserbacteria bacterium RIFCSPLOWO2_12_FULL_50_10]